MSYKVIGIVGPSGCGKDTAANYLGNKKKYNLVKLCTTRPKRDTEKGDEYNFLTSVEFYVSYMDRSIVYGQEYRGWYYGFREEDLDPDKINIIPMNNKMVEQILDPVDKFETSVKIEYKIIYIATLAKQRLMHILEREEHPDCEEVCRRFLADLKDYSDNEWLLQNCDYLIPNHYDEDFFDLIKKTAKRCFKGDKGKIV